MALPSLNSRLECLRKLQNPDGGWGHYAGQVSWLEPTVYAIFALWRLHRAEAERGVELLAKWQRADGALRPCGGIDEPHWATSLAATAWRVTGKNRAGQEGALRWLLGVQGAEGGWVSSLLKRVITMPAEQNEELHGWPWRPGTSSWIEPTAHALVALKQSAWRGRPEAQARIRMGEQMILERRCEDFGWNYGNRRVYGVPVPSYPETTGLALLGLRGRPEAAASQPRASLYWRAKPRGLGRAWLALGMQTQGWALDRELEIDLEPELPPGGDLTLTALEAVALQPEATVTFFRGEVAS